jgi:hypothetical protein
MKSPAFQWYPTDYLGSQRVQMMSLEQEGAYCRLIWYCWQHGSIPSGAEDAARLIGKGCSVELANSVLGMFQPSKEPGRLMHDRLEMEREKQAVWRKKSSDGGLKSAQVRWGKSVNNDKGGYKMVTRVVTKCLPPKGNSPSSSPSSSPVHKYSPSEGSSDHQAFIAEWVEAYKAAFGFDYQFKGGRDGKAVKLLLATNIETTELLRIAKDAWRRTLNDKFAAHCKQAATIHGFQDRLNQIRVELSTNAGEKPKGHVSAC